MAYYLKWSDDTGSTGSNNELLELSGITGSLASVSYIVRTDAVNFTTNRYLYDIRRQQGSTVDGGGASYLFQLSAGNSNSTGTSNHRINGQAVIATTLFDGFLAGDACSFDVNATPSDGTIAIGARLNEATSNYGFSVAEITIVDGAGTHVINMSDSNGTATTISSDTGNITATIYNFPGDNSHWVFYDPAAPSTAPENVSGDIVSGEAVLSWDAVPSSDSNDYIVEFRKKAP